MDSSYKGKRSHKKITHIIFINNWVLGEKLSIKRSCWPWKYVSTEITWPHFSVKHYLGSFILFSYVPWHLWGRECNVHDLIFFLKKIKWGFMSANATSRNSKWSLPVLLNHFWKNIIPTYQLYTKTWSFPFSTKFVSQANNFSIYWLKSFTNRLPFLHVSS